MRYLSIDIETKSGVDIKKTGLFKYAMDKDFEIMLLAYAFDDEEVKLVDFTRGEKLPLVVLEALNNKQIIKRAFNAFFEVFCLNRAGYKTDISEWECTMIKSFYLGLNGSLASVGNALGLAEDKAKDRTGKALIRYFCVPNSKGEFNPPSVNAEKWELFKSYNKQDVVAEREIARILGAFNLPPSEKLLHALDYEINSMGIQIDPLLVKRAIELDYEVKEELLEESKRITGISNVNSPMALCEWLSKKTGREIKSVAKTTVEELLKEDSLNDDVKRVLLNRQRTSKSSTAKYVAIENAMCDDNRVRGLLQFYGTKTGRWAGRLVQVHNLPKNYTTYLDEDRQLVKDGDFESLKLVEPDVADTLSQLIRTAFIPKEGNTFIVSDFSAIEARVLAWLSGETWRNDFFKGGGDIYCQSASLMFNVPVEKHGVNSHLRQKGKVAELACGYGGSVGALKAMGADKMGLSDEELEDIVSKWRASNKNITRFWKTVEKAVINTIKTGQKSAINGMLKMYTAMEYAKDKDGNFIEGIYFLTISLPSGRKLYYFRPEIKINRFGSESLAYKAIGKSGTKLDIIESYGGSLVENITQAVARDCLAVTLLRLKERGFNVVMHIHDEVVIEHREPELEAVNDILASPIPWAKDLRLKGAGFCANYYMKD